MLMCSRGRRWNLETSETRRGLGAGAGLLFLSGRAARYSGLMDYRLWLKKFFRKNWFRRSRRDVDRWLVHINGGAGRMVFTWEKVQ